MKGLVHTSADNVSFDPSKKKEFRSWNRIQWWNWRAIELYTFLNDDEVMDWEAYNGLYQYVLESGLFIGTKVKFDFHGRKVVGYIEEPLISNGKYITNIERVRFSGKNSLDNYLIKGIPLEELKVVEYLDETEVLRLFPYLSKSQLEMSAIYKKAA